MSAPAQTLVRPVKEELRSVPRNEPRRDKRTSDSSSAPSSLPMPARSDTLFGAKGASTQVNLPPETRTTRSQTFDTINETRTAQPVRGKAAKVYSSDSEDSVLELAETSSDDDVQRVSDSETESEYGSTDEDEDETDAMLREHQKRQQLQQSAESKKAKEGVKKTIHSNEMAHMASSLLYETHSKTRLEQRLIRPTSTLQPRQQLSPRPSGNPNAARENTTSAGSAAHVELKVELGGGKAKCNAIRQTDKQEREGKTPGIKKKIGNMFRSSKKTERG